MNQKVINKSKEEVYEILTNSKNKKEFVFKLGYKDARSAKKICERFQLNLLDLGKNVGGSYGSPLIKGQVFDYLTVVDPNCSKIDGETASLCRCKCGQDTVVKNDFLKRGHTTSCGCKKGHDKNNQIITGQKFGKLTVINANYKKNDHNDFVSLCQCQCGNILDVRNNTLRRGQYSCGCNGASRAERKVASLLTQAGIKFKQEAIFPDLKSLNGKPLRFDFIIYDNNNKIICAIETDGEQHFHQVPYFQKTIFEFRQTQEWDRRKNAYCLRKGIPLIRVPYWDYDNITLEKILTEPSYRVINKFHNDLLNRR